MEVRSQITLCFIVCCCANIIYTEDLADGNRSSNTPPTEESSYPRKLKTGHLSGKINAHKNGAKLELNVDAKAFWNDNKSIDSKSCTTAVKQTGEKGDTGKYGPPGPAGSKGKKGDKGADADQGKIGKKGEKGVKGNYGSRGINGNKGEKGRDGINRPKGDKGKTGTCSATMDKAKRHDYGKETNPAYSCNILGKDGKYYLNPENGFEMLCQNNETCIQGPSSNNFTNLGLKKGVWLTNKLHLQEFYRLKLSQLSYLITTSEGFHLTMDYSKDVKMLKILCWNGITIDLEEDKKNGCKVTKEDQEMHTRLYLKCKLANYLPMNFRIETETENVSMKLIKLCFI